MKLGTCGVNKNILNSFCILLMQALVDIVLHRKVAVNYGYNFIYIKYVVKFISLVSATVSFNTELLFILLGSTPKSTQWLMKVQRM
jgi:hypothetical protein